jgi:TRAP-type C4-dicarboxylate transport system substrate-binding protein
MEVIPPIYAIRRYTRINMANTEKLSPRIDSEWKRALDRHVDRVNSSKGDEVGKAIKHWLATYYLINEDELENLPEEERDLVNKAIAKQTYEIREAHEKLEARQSPSLDSDDILNMVKQVDDDVLRQSIKDAVSEGEN